MRLVRLASSDCACVWTLTDGVPDPTANGRSSVKLSVDVDVLQLLQTIKLFSSTSSVGMPLSMAQEYVPNSAPFFTLVNIIITTLTYFYYTPYELERISGWPAASAQELELGSMITLPFVSSRGER